MEASSPLRVGNLKEELAPMGRSCDIQVSAVVPS